MFTSFGSPVRKIVKYIKGPFLSPPLDNEFSYIYLLSPYPNMMICFIFTWENKSLIYHLLIKRNFLTLNFIKSTNLPESRTNHSAFLLFEWKNTLCSYLGPIPAIVHQSHLLSPIQELGSYSCLLCSLNHQYFDFCWIIANSVQACCKDDTKQLL